MKKFLITEILSIFFLSIFAQEKQSNSNSFVDSRNGKSYKTVRIGKQIWMAENLKFATPTGSWCYNDSTINCEKYGTLYDWDGANIACPSGWHLPTVTDFEYLVGIWPLPESNEYEVKETTSDPIGNDAYKHLLPDGDSGLNIILSGWRFSSGYFYGIDNFTGFWSSSTGGFGGAWSLYLESNNKTAEVSSYYKNIGFSVRCIKNK